MLSANARLGLSFDSTRNSISSPLSPIYLNFLGKIFIGTSCLSFIMVRGRPVKSEIRRNIIDLLGYMRRGYGYEIYKLYLRFFPRCTIEVVYYNLRKGVVLEEFVIDAVKREKGGYSWGPIAQKTYYVLGPNAAPRKRKRLDEYFKTVKRNLQ